MTENTWTCPDCGGTLTVTETNEAQYPEPLVETRGCKRCQYERTEVLTA